ncbi:uncharacterized protein LOC143056824 [Mytilus galloprovincialis]|uniref:uncharacterized protein LOC143056824 n=1 Tax=Mytilus galloprovincialis TaxID=29158 RepID=UPI003F7BFC06
MTLKLSLRFVIVCCIQLLCFASSLLRDESDYGCFVFGECPPGKEVIPCFESNGFQCAVCSVGYVQPSYVTSNQHYNDTTCFKPTRRCVAEDITYSRTKHKSFCDSLDGCKCNTNKCYYGDPCLCYLHTTGCPVNTSLDEYGGCQPCDPGTAKNDTGCGPCRAVLQKLPSLPGNVTARIHKKRPLLPTMETVTNSIKEDKSDKISRSNPIFMERTFIAIAIGLTFIVLLLVIVIVVMLWRWKQCCFAQGNTRSKSSSNGRSGANEEENIYMISWDT